MRGAGSASQAAGIVLRDSSWQGKMRGAGSASQAAGIVLRGGDHRGSWKSSVHGGSALELDEGTVMEAGGARCTVEVRWSWDEGIVMAVKEHGARWKCAGAVMKGP